MRCWQCYDGGKWTYLQGYICLVKHVALPVSNASFLKLRDLRSFQIFLKWWGRYQGCCCLWVVTCKKFHYWKCRVNHSFIAYSPLRHPLEVPVCESSITYNHNWKLEGGAHLISNDTVGHLKTTLSWSNKSPLHTQNISKPWSLKVYNFLVTETSAVTASLPLLNLHTQLKPLHLDIQVVASRDRTDGTMVTLWDEKVSTKIGREFTFTPAACWSHISDLSYWFTLIY